MIQWQCFNRRGPDLYRTPHLTYVPLELVTLRRQRSLT
jgi:hypothetical protein